jgi:hypothetical protein
MSHLMKLAEIVAAHHFHIIVVTGPLHSLDGKAD